MSEITNIIKHGKDTYSIFLDGSFFANLTRKQLLKTTLKLANKFRKKKLKARKPKTKNLLRSTAVLNFFPFQKQKSKLKTIFMERVTLQKPLPTALKSLKNITISTTKPSQVYMLNPIPLKKENDF